MALDARLTDTGEHHCINVIRRGYDKHVISRDPVCLFSRFINAAELHGRIGAARESQIPDKRRVFIYKEVLAMQLNIAPGSLRQR